jgi:hypothetical protein
MRTAATPKRDADGHVIGGGAPRPDQGPRLSSGQPLRF